VEVDCEGNSVRLRGELVQKAAGIGRVAPVVFTIRRESKLTHVFHSLFSRNMFFWAMRGPRFHLC